MTRDVEHLFTYLLAIRASALGKLLFSVSFYFSIRLLSFSLLIFMDPLYVQIAAPQHNRDREHALPLRRRPLRPVRGLLCRAEALGVTQPHWFPSAFGVTLKKATAKTGIRELAQVFT